MDVGMGIFSESSAQQVQECHASFSRRDLPLGLLQQEVCDRLQLSGLYQ